MRSLKLEVHDPRLDRINTDLSCLALVRLHIIGHDTSCPLRSGYLYLMP